MGAGIGHPKTTCTSSTRVGPSVTVEIDLTLCGFVHQEHDSVFQHRRRIDEPFERILVSIEIGLALRVFSDDKCDRCSTDDRLDWLAEEPPP